MFTTFYFLLSNPASAFCGTYVGSAGADLFSHTSQVAIARQGDQTTLTLVNDYEGSLDDFALVIPVPSILTEDDVAVVEESVLSRVEAYSSPRLVEYSCEDFYTPWRPDEVSIGCFATAEYSVADMGDAEIGESAESSVTIESSFSVGEYNLAVLSAEEGGELNEWLDTYGFSLGADASAVLQEYIDAGSYFLISRVKLNTSPEGQTWLRPLQISYTSEVFSLPIKLGTLNSPGEQDLIVYTVTDVYQGHIGIQNYPEISIQADCMLENTEDFASFYRERLDDAFAGQDGGWLREHGWGAYHCDPCVDGDAMSDDDIRALGFSGSAFDAYVGRLHMRFTPEAATEDVVFYHSNIEDQTQQRYIRYVEELESRFLICDQESLDASKNCDALYEEWDAERKEVAKGCFSTHMRSPIGLLLGSIFVSVFFMRNR
ncbi:MAG: DUF2330 domain-containing protein, partial [Myxococcota bacterium]|nr:DUF2330 domain-containing protein [Myxococcota bacterium]